MKKILIALGAMAALGSCAFAYTHVTADITTNTQWTVANSPYILENVIYVKGCTLDIEPGVVIRGQPRTNSVTFNPGALVVRTDAKIQARGTAANPIIFTTAALDAGLDAGGAATGIFKDSNVDGIADRWSTSDGDTKYLDLNPATSPLPPKNGNGVKNANMWGGLVIAGDALTNSGKQVDVDTSGTLTSPEDDGYGYIEGLGTGTDAIYGGFNSEHNGGILKYVSIRHGGAELTTGRELNGLTLYAVGSKTTVSYIDVYSTGDDGIEIFGGAVNLDHLNLNYCDDDGLDIDEGYHGLVQYVFVLQGQGFGDNGLELDGEDKLENDTCTNPVFPVGDARLYNITALVSTETGVSASGASVNGVRMRAGFAGQIVNSIIFNYSTTAASNGIRIDGLKTSGLGAGETAEYGNSARNNFETKLLQIRNTTAAGFTNNYVAFTSGSVSLSATGAISGITTDVYYPAALLRTLSTGITVPNHTTANGVDPRPSLSANALAYGTTQDLNYVVSPANVIAYKGAFDRTASTLWTFGWTALNKRGILKN